MNHREAGRYWDGNAEAWSALSRAGYNACRDRILNPWFFAMLPDVTGLEGLDIGCGDGDNTREMTRRGAQMRGVDIAPRFIAIAEETERADPRGVQYVCASAVELPFPDESFDFAVAFMSLMDVPEFEVALAECYRIVRPGGFLQFSITHPCCDVPHRRKVKNTEGEMIAMEVGGYFAGSSGQVLEWIFGAAPPEARAPFPRFRQPQLHHTLSEWFNALTEAGFALERVEEPYPSGELLGAVPGGTRRLDLAVLPSCPLPKGERSLAGEELLLIFPALPWRQTDRSITWCLVAFVVAFPPRPKKAASTSVPGYVTSANIFCFDTALQFSLRWESQCCGWRT